MAVSRVTCFCLCIHATSFFFKQHRGLGKNSTLGSSVAAYKWDDPHLQIREWGFFPEICSVGPMERVHVKAPVNVRLGLGNVDGCGGS